MELAYQLSTSKRGAMVAPAGCGKTHIIGQALSLGTTSGRELVLTHTHAGVNALKCRMRKLGVSASRYRVETIAGWALRLVGAFPRSASLGFANPTSQDQYKLMYQAAANLLTSKPIEEVMKASYTGVYVDEYQDCSVPQHQIVMSLARFLPCRVLGDPMQRIFDFGENETVEWEEHVAPNFAPLPELSCPWRWHKVNERLGAWLLQQRRRLRAREPLDLANAPIRILSSDVNDVTKLCWGLSRTNETVVIIRSVNQRCHALASRMKGQYCCIEPIDVKDLTKYAAILDNKRGLEIGVCLIDFACSCATKLKTELKSLRSAFVDGRIPRVRKHKNILVALEKAAERPTPTNLQFALSQIFSISGVSIYRRELQQEMERALELREQGATDSYAEAALAARNRTRQIGRRLPTRSMGTTLLVKGLEFDHAVVVDPNDMGANDLYVALTRGAKSLTIVSDSTILNYKGVKVQDSTLQK